jgi:hypothetical protein
MTAPLYYIMTPEGDSLYVRGRISVTKDIVQVFGFLGYPDTAHVDIYATRTLSPFADNTLPVYRSGTTIRNVTVPNSLDAAPISTWDCSTLMGPHGLQVPVVRSVGHNKVSADLLSDWTDGTYYFRLVNITGEYLTFYSIPYMFSNVWAMRTAVAGTLTHLFGATNTGNITVTSQVGTEKNPVTKNVAISVVKNGTTTLAGGDAGVADSLKILEEFDLVDPSTLDSTNVPWQWNDGDAWMHVKNTYHVNGGTTLIHTEYAVLRDMGLRIAYMTIVGLPISAVHDSTYFYLPKLKLTPRDFSVPVLYKVPFTAISAFTDSVTSTSNPPDRMVELFKKTGENTLVPFDLGFAHGYGPFLSADPATRKSKVGNASCLWSVNEAGKSYPNLYGKSDVSVYLAPAGTNIEAYTYRQWFDPKPYSTTKWAYWNKATPNGDDLVFVDYFAAVTNDATVLPTSMLGKTVTVVDTLAVTIGTATVPATGITISTNPTKTKGFAVLRLSTP